MNKDLSSQIEWMFAQLNRQSAAGAIPEPSALSNLLSGHVVESSASTVIPANPGMLTHFATASVEM
jgi:hypothetical protein